MVDIVQTTMDYRRNNQIVRKDFIQLLLELQETGKVENDESFRMAQSGKGELHLSVEECAAQVGLFYLAGFDTTASAIAFTIFEIARKPELQKKLQAEIDETLAKHNNEITYQSANEMTFLEACVKGSIFVIFASQFQFYLFA